MANDLPYAPPVERSSDERSTDEKMTDEKSSHEETSDTQTNALPPQSSSSEVEIEIGLVKRALKGALNAPEATVSVIDARQHSSAYLFLLTAVHGKSLFLVEDAARDDRFKDNFYVKGASKVRFYAGMPLYTTEGSYIGSLCIIDDEPHTVGAMARGVIEDMAQLVVDQFELRQRLERGEANGRSEKAPGERVSGDGQADYSSEASEEAGREPFDTASTANMSRELSGYASKEQEERAQADPGRDSKKPKGEREASSRNEFLKNAPAIDWTNVLDEDIDNISADSDPLERLKEKLIEGKPQEGEIALVGHIKMPDGRVVTLPEEPLHRALDRVLRTVGHDSLLVSVELWEEHTLLRFTEENGSYSAEIA